MTEEMKSATIKKSPGRPRSTERVPVGADVDKVSKRRRIPIADSRDRLAFPKNPEYHRVVVTDIKNQVQDFLDSGFEFVTQDMIQKEGWRSIGERDPRDGSPIDTRVRWYVGRAHVKDNAEAFLMQIPMAEWKEIKKIIHEDRQGPIRELFRNIEGMKNEQAGFYGMGLSATFKEKG